MAAEDGHRLAILQLRGRHPEDDGLAIKRHPLDMKRIVGRESGRHLIGFAEKVVLQGNLPPEVWHNEVLRRVKIVGPGHTRPFPSQLDTVGIGDIIIIGDGLHRMLTGLYGRGFQFPVPPVVCRHRQTAHFLGGIPTRISDGHIEVFTPLCTVLNGKS